MSAVQFVRFPISAAGRRALGDLGTPAALVCTHPALPATARLAPVTRGALVGDLG